MTATSLYESDAIEHLMHAIELLDAAGYSCWLAEEFAVENLLVCLEGIPNDIPLLPGEIELLAGVHDAIIALAGWEDEAVVSRPKSGP